MIQEVVVSQPVDPLEYMINFLHRQNDDGKYRDEIQQKYNWMKYSWSVKVY